MGPTAPQRVLWVIFPTRVRAMQLASTGRIKLRAALSKTLIAIMTRHSRRLGVDGAELAMQVIALPVCFAVSSKVASAVASLLREAVHRAAGASGSLGRGPACLAADPGRGPGSAFFCVPQRHLA